MVMFKVVNTVPVKIATNPDLLLNWKKKKMNEKKKEKREDKPSH